MLSRAKTTRKPCYRKDDRAMRPMYLKIFGSPWLQSRLYFQKLLTCICCDRSY